MTGAKVIEAIDGKEALAKISSSKPDLIMLDIHMPLMDGVTVVKIIKNCDTNRHCPVIIISSDHEAINAFNRDFPGIEGFLEKPFQPLDLLHKVAEILASTDNNR